MSAERRRFLRIAATAGSLLGAGGLYTLLRSGRVARVTETRLVMGTLATLTLYAGDEQAAVQAVEQTFGRMAFLESIFTRFHPGSVLSGLNRQGRFDEAPADFLYVLRRALEYGDLTGGAFDVSVEPLLAHYRMLAHRGESPTQAQIDRLLPLVDYHRIEIDGARVCFGTEGMAITLDGIAKGYVIDQAVELLTASGFGDVLVDVGGDMRAAGLAGTRTWRVGIQTPEYPYESLAAELPLLNAALTTSGGYINVFDDTSGLHHLIDPRTGRSPWGLGSVSVMAPTALDADALSTAIYIMGADRGQTLVQQLQGIDLLVIRETRPNP